MYILILVILDIVLTLALGGIVLYANLRNRTNLWFFLFTLFSASWTFTNYLSVSTQSTFETLLYIKLVLFVTVWMLGALLRFSWHYPDNKKVSRLKAVCFYLITGAVSVVMFLPITVESVNVSDTGVSPKFGPAYALYPLYIIGALVWALGTLIHKYKKSYGIDKVRIQYIFLGFVLFALFPLITNLLFVVVFKVSNFVVFGPFSLLVLDGFIVYSIRKHKFLGVRFIIGNLIFFTYLVSIPYLGAYLILSVETRMFNGAFTIPGYLVNIFLAILSVFSYEYSSKKFKNFLNRRIIAIDFDPVEERALFSEKMSRELDIKVLADLFATEFKRWFNPTKVGIFVFNKKHRIDYSKTDFVHDSELIRLIRQNWKNFHQDLISVQDYATHRLDNQYINSELIVKLKKYDISIVILLHDESDLLGVLLGGEKKNKDAYLVNDMEFLNKLIIDYSVALQRAVLYSETQSFAQVLQQKVEEATSILRTQKEQLQEKYQFEKDMMGIMGHELRTPMTVARGLSELVLAKIHNKNLEMDYADDKIQKIYGSIIKEADLIQTMLSSAHIDNKKVNLQITEVDLLDVVEYAVAAFKKDATDKGLELNFTEPEKAVPVITSDSARVQEIVNNLVSNAVKYTNKGSVTVNLEVTKDFLYVHVADTGIGIPASELKNLGKKFYRIHQHLDDKKDVVRAGGTGLGLYVVKGLLEALGGGLKVKSKDGVGSTFSAYFPVKSTFKDNVFITDKPVDEHDMFEKLGLKTPTNTTAHKK